jgi:hypothetical protein
VPVADLIFQRTIRHAVCAGYTRRPGICWRGGWGAGIRMLATEQARISGRRSSGSGVRSSLAGLSPRRSTTEPSLIVCRRLGCRVETDNRRTDRGFTLVKRLGWSSVEHRTRTARVGGHRATFATTVRNRYDASLGRRATAARASGRLGEPRYAVGWQRWGRRHLSRSVNSPVTQRAQRSRRRGRLAHASSQPRRC